MMQPEQINTDVLIIGAGPAGLAAATQLRKLGVEKVLLIDRESQAGGIPRHCYHTGFGWLDLRRILSGPSYADENVHRAEQAGVEIITEATAQHWTDDLSLQITSPTGLKNITANAILLATGCRERPRAAKLIPGSRPLGIYNTGLLQQLIYLKKLKLGKKAIVIGAEHVSYSAVRTLHRNGAQVMAMITEYSQHQTYLPFYWGARLCYRTPLLTNYKVTDIHGRMRVEAIEITSTQTGEKKQLECDTLIFTGDWIPDHDLARKGNITLNKYTNGPDIDQSLRTSKQGIFAAGNLLHGVEKADTAALEGRHVAQSIVRYLSTTCWPLNNRIPLVVNSPLLWISPNIIVPENNTTLPLDHFTFRTGEFLQKTAIGVVQGGKLLHAQTFRKLIPNRWFYLDNDWISQLNSKPDNKKIYIQIM
ncbi:MAG: FAD-dependent oxidoreductase [Gammaproteobacteria bacterium]